MTSQRPSRPKNQGQILVLMAMMSTTLIILFGMVVGIGHIVEAKINLQNAVDLAAMAGASQQARFLNHIALINYRMRQNYKFTLYDLYVTESRFNRGLLREVVPSGPPPGMYSLLGRNGFTFGICQQSYGYTPHVHSPLAALPYPMDPLTNIPAEPGRGTSLDTDMCQHVDESGRSIPPIVASPIPTFDPILLLINATILGLSAQAQQVCRDSGEQNQYYLHYVLHQFLQRQRFQVQQLASILGEFSKAFDQGAPNGDLLTSHASANAVVAQTFRDNLLSASANSNMKLEFLNPPETRSFIDKIGGSSSNYYEGVIFTGAQNPNDDFGKYFERQTVSITIPWAKFQDNGGCQISVESETSPAMILGLSRTRAHGIGPVQVPMSVALRATVTPNLLFWPRGLTPTLVAIGAAKPFGSRVGPPRTMSNLEVNGTAGSSFGNYANMSFYPGDISTGSAEIAGVGHKYILWQLLHLLPAHNGQNEYRPSILNSSANDCISNPSFLCYALAPTLYEGLFWNAYPFPIQNVSSSNAFNSIFPNDLTLQVADPTLYNLPDRMPANYNPSADDLKVWHTTTFMGAASFGGVSHAFRDQNKPVFFADYVSGLSSWSPDYAVTPAGIGDPIDPTAGGETGPTVSVKGRMGYQIKLASINEICSDIALGATVNVAGSALEPYCDQTKEDSVVH